MFQTKPSSILLLLLSYFIIILILNNICMKQTNKRVNEFIFLYEEAEPQSLVMLKPIDQIVSLCYKEIYTIKYVWIDNNGAFFRQQLYNRIRSEPDTTIVRMKNFAEFKKHFSQTFLNHYYVLICQQTGQTFQIEQQDEINNKYQYRVLDVYKLATSPQNEHKRSLIFSDEKQLFEALKDRNQRSSKQKFGNGFLFLTSADQKNEKQIEDSTIIAKTLVAMVSQNLGLKVQSELNNKMKELFSQLRKVDQKVRNNYGRKQMQFFADLAKGISNRQAIQWYSEDTQIYSIFNKFLRVMRKPTELFYLQPFFRPLYQAIAQKHKYGTDKTKFTCFRGGHITQQEFKRFKKGQIIQNLNFMSASLDRYVAEGFIMNAYFTIEVDENHQQRKYSRGYAFIEAESKSKGENEVLFNPLNSFEVLQDIQKPKNWFEIRLRYSPLGEGEALLNKVASKQTKMRAMSKYKKMVVSVVKKQGDVLDLENLRQGTQQYWVKYFEILKKIQESKNWNLKQLNFQRIFVLNKIGCFYTNKYKINEAKLCFDEATELLEKEFSKQMSEKQMNKYSEMSISLLNNKGFIHSNAEEKLECCRKSLLVVKQKLGEESIQYAQILSQLGLKLFDQKDTQNALKYLKMSQNILSKKLFVGLAIQRYTTILNNLATVYRKIGQFSKALMYFHKAQKNFIVKNIPYSTILNNLGELYTEMGELERGLQYLKQSLAIRKQKLGKESFLYATTLVNLGIVYMKQSIFDKAFKCFKNSLNILKQGFNTSYAHILLNFGSLYDRIGEPSKAIAYLRKSSDIFEYKNDKHHLVISLSNLAAAYRSQRSVVQLKDSLACLNDCLKINIQLFGFQSQQTSTTLQNIGLVNLNLGNFQEAKARFQESLQILGKDYSHQGISDQLQSTHFKKQRFQKQKQFQSSQILENLGIVHLALGELEYAQTYLEKAAKFQVRKANSGDYFDISNILKNIYQNNGPQLKRLAEIIKKKFSPSTEKQWETNGIQSEAYLLCNQFLELHLENGLDSQTLLREFPQQLKDNSYLMQEMKKAGRVKYEQLKNNQRLVEAQQVSKFVLFLQKKEYKQSKQMSILKKIAKIQTEEFLLRPDIAIRSWRTKEMEQFLKVSLKKLGQNSFLYVLMKRLEINQLITLGRYEQMINNCKTYFSALVEGYLSQEACQLIDLWAQQIIQLSEK